MACARIQLSVECHPYLPVDVRGCQRSYGRNMTNSTKHLRIAGAVLATGGLLWVAKFVVIAATDGALSGLPDLATSVLYVSAVTLMPLGMAGVGLALLTRHHVMLKLAGAVGGIVAWVISYIVIERIAQAAVGDTDPVWLGDEIGIVATGAVLMTAGLLLARRPSRRVHHEVAASA